jgi:hypothetical protein
MCLADAPYFTLSNAGQTILFIKGQVEGHTGFVAVFEILESL